jgi:hypothetical protein
LGTFLIDVYIDRANQLSLVGSLWPVSRSSSGKAKNPQQKAGTNRPTLLSYIDLRIKIATTNGSVKRAVNPMPSNLNAIGEAKTATIAAAQGQFSARQFRTVK